MEELKQKYRKIMMIATVILLIVISVGIFVKNQKKLKENQQISQQENNSNLDYNARLQNVQTQINEQENLIKEIQKEMNLLNQKEEELIALKVDSNKNKEEIEKELQEVSKKQEEKQKKLRNETDKVSHLYEEYNAIMSEYSSGVPTTQEELESLQKLEEEQKIE